MTIGRYLAVLGLLVVLTILVAGGVIKRRRLLVSRMKQHSGASSFLLWLGKIFPFLSGAFATWNEVWKPESWSKHPVDCSYALFVVVILVVMTYGTEWFRERLKDEMTEKLAALERDRNVLKIERDRWLRLANQVKKLIDRKIVAIRALSVKPEVSVEEYLAAWDRQVQVHTILKAIHEFFRFELTQRRADAQMRLGLYMPTADMTQMSLAYAWDGESNECFANHPERMKLVSAGGLKSLIAETFHLAGNQRLSIIPDCGADAQFKYFSPEQAEYLRSMIAFKYQLTLDGTETALVLSLDTDEAGFFSTERTNEITVFLIEMMKRFEYELLNLEVTKKIKTKQQ